MGLFEKIFGTYSDKVIKQIKPIVEQINSLEPEMQKRSDAELAELTVKYRQRLAEGETLDDILPEAFATVREAAVRVLGQRHYDVQLIGGIVLHRNMIAEMKTGEGKTLVSTLPAYLNALEGKGVHIVTVNDYLAKRDSEWMGKVFKFLGLTVGVILHDKKSGERRDAYNCDITYGTNNELGFDYLRDNMVTYKENLVQRDLNYAIVDEVDSILIDEARTPLIISGAGEKSSELYEKADKFAATLKALTVKETDKKDLLEDVKEDYIIDEKARNASLTENGVKKAEAWFGLENLADSQNAELRHHINQAIKARGIMKRDIDYVVKDNSVIIVDEFTGRLMFGRRYNEGLHQAIEAKEGVKIEKESMTQATITFQNFFRLYSKIAGMTGTASTEAEEFREIYGLGVVEIPTNKPVIRIDHPDSVYKTVKGKYEALIRDVIEAHEKGQPVLIGTVSIEKSEYLSKLIGARGIKHNVLNAKNHEREAEIVAQAGKFGAVTIATNMAGRGTDIIPGGNSEFMAKQELRRQGMTEDVISLADSYSETDDQVILEVRKKYRELVRTYSEQLADEKKKVLEAGGLFIMGTERHESRRIDNQLRGRSGRQGDPGMSRFYLSLEDDLMRLFGSEKIETVFSALKIPDDQPIEHKMLSNVIESAQRKVEAKNYEIRKTVLQYDDVMNQQREIIYAQRRRVLDGEDLRSFYLGLIDQRAEELAEEVFAEHLKPEERVLGPAEDALSIIVSPDAFTEIKKNLASYKNKADFSKAVSEKSRAYYEEREKIFGERAREIERIFLLYAVDRNWMSHIDTLDQLRTSIGLRAVAQHDPVVEYQHEAYEMFDDMNETIKHEALRGLFSIRIQNAENVERRNVARNSQEGAVKRRTPTAAQQMKISAQSARNDTGAAGRDAANSTVPVRREKAKVGRNDPCPCGSGKKYKNCCGKDED
ncbi:MAG: preprotein translocase subunit SecA [Clostridia bacterium]|nr:preprotein translocase subunit SecA [Clostridia bacterium]